MITIVFIAFIMHVATRQGCGLVSDQVKYWISRFKGLLHLSENMLFVVERIGVADQAEHGYRRRSGGGRLEHLPRGMPPALLRAILASGSIVRPRIWVRVRGWRLCPRSILSMSWMKGMRLATSANCGSHHMRARCSHFPLGKPYVDSISLQKLIV